MHQLKHGYCSNGVTKREWEIWSHMRRRCSKPNDISFKNYGGRGISVCMRWENSFQNFIEDMGPCPPGCSIERIDVNGNYFPSNCKWATKHEQVRNLRKNVWLEHEGVKMIMKDWSIAIGMDNRNLHKYIKLGFTIGQIIDKRKRYAERRMKNAKTKNNEI